MDDLVDFIRARLDEDEAAAKAVGYARIETGEYLWGSKYLLLQDGKDGASKATTEFDGDLADHISRHDPARVLAEVEAKRRIVQALESAEVALRNTEPGKEPHELMTGAANSLRAAVRMHAAVYADHPDYREEWRP